jgi:uncharacterized protein (TIGR03000 family)
MTRTRSLILGTLAGLALLALSAPGPSQAPDEKKAADGDQPVLLTVRIAAGAQLEIGGQLTRQTGEVRRFISPPIPPGKNYYYILRWRPDGDAEFREQKVWVEPGKETEVDLRSPIVAKKEEPKKEEEEPKLTVPYVPTPQEVVDEMLKLADVKKDDVVYDLGCGDGRIVVTAAKKYGAKGVGVDLNPERIKESLANVKKNEVEDLVKIQKGDVLKTDVSGATVVTLYLLPKVNLELMPILKKSLKPGSRVVSHDFDMGDWKPDKTVEVKDKDGTDHTLYLWIIGKAGEDKKEEAKKEIDESDLPVPYVPTPQEVVDEMLKLAEVGKGDVVYDLGCGDGRIVVTAAKKFGARGVGVDLNPVRVKESLENVKKNKVEKLVEIKQGDALKTDVSPATVVTLYLLPSVNEKLRPILQKNLKPGSRVVSHDFDIADWKPLKTVEVKGPNRTHTLYLWKIDKDGGDAPPDKEKKDDAKDKKEDAKDKDTVDREPDVIFVPTPQEVVEAMLKLAGVKKGDVVYDLGCGDGRIPVTAAKQYGVKAYGFDIDPERIKESLENVKKNKVEELVTITRKDIFTLDLTPASVVTLYLLPSLNVKLIPQLEKMKPGTRIVSHSFDMRGVKPDKVERVQLSDGGERTIYLWTVPLKKEKEKDDD